MHSNTDNGRDDRQGDFPGGVLQVERVVQYIHIIVGTFPIQSCK